jgi:hypothetical protein
MALVDEILQRDHRTTLEKLLRDRRDHKFSFDQIARELTDLIDIDGFSVGYNSIRRWCLRLKIEERSQEGAA